MTSAEGFEGLEVLLVAPTGRDAKMIQDALKLSGVRSRKLESIAEVVESFYADDVGALMLAEESLEHQAIAKLSSALQQQPAWSALPVLILTSGGSETFESRSLRRQRVSLGHTVLLERPIRVSTLVSAVKAALIERAAQYDHRNAEIALRESEKLALVGRMASSIAHEINNPLEAITNLLYILENTPLSEDQRRLLNTAQSELTRVSQIAAQTLTFNRQRNVRGDASVCALLDSVLMLYQGRLAGSKVSIERRYQNTAPISCYPGELRQVFANLIGNAFDATRNAGGRIILRERIAKQPSTQYPGVRVTIADTGQGMPEKVKARLFAAFNSSKGNNGSGLGLWISRGIIEKHNGDIRFRSCTRPGRNGTVFSIFLPNPEQGKAQSTNQIEAPIVNHDRIQPVCKPALRTA